MMMMTMTSTLLAVTAQTSASTDVFLALVSGLSVLGLLLLLLLLLLIVGLCLRRRRQQQDDDHEQLDCGSSTTTESAVDSCNSGDVAVRSPPSDPTSRRSQRAPNPENRVAARARSMIVGGSLWTGRGRSSPKTGRDAASGKTSPIGTATSAVSPGSGKTPTASSGAQLRERTARPDASVHVPSANPLPGMGPERPWPAGPTGRHVCIPPNMRREPRGWAPASHAVPAPVKRTWGRARAKQAGQQANGHAKQ